MTTVNKGGIHIEQCEGCRGIFLDRGELEQIVGAENAYYAQPAAPPYRPAGPPAAAAPPHAAPPPPPHHGYGDSPRPHRGYGDSPRPYRGGYHEDSPRPFHGGYGDSPRPYHGGHHGHRRRRSFLENLFD
jgi:Zn-finger nucleic acid-binding protein